MASLVCTELGCTEKFANKNLRTNHFRNAHQNYVKIGKLEVTRQSEYPPWTCVVCKKGFTLTTTLVSHTRRVHKEEVAGESLPSLDLNGLLIPTLI